MSKPTALAAGISLDLWQSKRSKLVHAAQEATSLVTFCGLKIPADINQTAYEWTGWAFVYRNWTLAYESKAMKPAAEVITCRQCLQYYTKANPQK